MAHSVVIEGTSEEIIAILKDDALLGRNLRLIIDPDTSDLSDCLPDPPNTVRDLDHLEQLLLEGLASGPAVPMTHADFEELRREIECGERINGQRPNGDA